MQQAAQSEEEAVKAERGDRLLLAIAEELKLPLQQIARRAELGQLQPADTTLTAIQTTADMTVQLLDNYLWSARMALEPDYDLNVEPVALSAVLYETKQQLSALAQLYGVQLCLDIDGRFAPVLANRQGLQAALTSLGYALIAALPSLQAEPSEKLTLHLAVHHSRYGVVAGLYSDARQLSMQALQRGRELHGRVRQPLATLSPSSGAGIFVADAMLQAMASQLRPTRHRRLYGLGAVLQPTPQLQLL